MKAFFIKNKRGFTLVELIVIIAIFAILTGISIPVFANRLEDAKATTCEANRRILERAINFHLAQGNDWVPTSMDPVEEMKALDLIAMGEGCPSDGKYLWVDSDGAYHVYCTEHTIDTPPPHFGDAYIEGQYEYSGTTGNSDTKFTFIRTKKDSDEYFSDFNTEATFSSVEMRDNDMLGIIYRLNKDCNFGNVKGSSFAIQKKTEGGEAKYYACFSPIKSGHFDTNSNKFESIEISEDLSNIINTGEFKMNVFANGKKQYFYINNQLIMETKNSYQRDNGDVGIAMSANNNNDFKTDIEVYEIP